MSVILDKLVAFALLHGYDAVMLLLVYLQTLIGAVALRSEKLAKVYPLRLVRSQERGTGGL